MRMLNRILHAVWWVERECVCVCVRERERWDYQRCVSVCKAPTTFLASVAARDKSHNFLRVPNWLNSTFELNP